MASKNQPHSVIDAPFYFPLETGVYEVKPGLYRFPHDFGNGLSEQQIFQFDETFPQYHTDKLTARAERLEKYYCRSGFDTAAAKTINRFIIQRLLHEHPLNFSLEQNKDKHTLHCRFSQETLTFDTEYNLRETSSPHSISRPFIDSFDALVCQVQEDLAVIRCTATGDDQVIALHLCFPNHWAAEDKIGKSFLDVHRPVPDMDRIKLSAGQLLQALVHKGPYIRFAWGISTDKRLNHHPVPPAETRQDIWEGRAFNLHEPKLYLRIERQVIYGFSKDCLVLFTIRTYFYDIAHIHKNHPGHIPVLISAVESMSNQSMHYKGIQKDAPVMLDWLRKIAG